MKHWTLEQIPWSRFDPARVDPEIVKLVKAAAMVEFNGGDYATHQSRGNALTAKGRCHIDTGQKRR